MVDETMLLALVFSISSRPAAANLSSSAEPTGRDLLAGEEVTSTPARKKPAGCR